MDEQAFEDMQVPSHLLPNGSPHAPTRNKEEMEAEAAAATAAAAEEAEAFRAHRAVLDARIAELKAAASDKNIDVSDIDFGAITLAQLEAVAAARLGAAPKPAE